MIKKIATGVLTTIILAGCYNDKYEELYPSGTVVCDTTTITYSKDIIPIMAGKCNTAGCHNNAAATGYDFTTREGILVAINNGRLKGSISWESGYSSMPKGLPKLAQCDIDKITRWINQGAPDN